VPDAETPDGDGPATALETWLGIGLLLLLAVLLCLWGAFLVPLRVGTTRLPICLLVAGVGNLLLGRTGGRLLGTNGVLLPGMLWLVLAYLLGTRRSEGDLVVQGDLIGTLFLLVGALGFAAAYVTTASRRGASPEGGPSR
jgi:hypothetical protein